MDKIATRPNETEQKALRQYLRNNKTAPEAVFWQVVKGRQVDGLKFRRQYGFGPYILDFYCPEIRLCIELDGEVHKSASADEYDRIRTHYLNTNDITVIRFDNEVVYRNIEGIILQIRKHKEKWDELKQDRINNTNTKGKNGNQCDGSDHPYPLLPSWTSQAA